MRSHITSLITYINNHGHRTVRGQPALRTRAPRPPHEQRQAARRLLHQVPQRTRGARLGAHHVPDVGPRAPPPRDPARRDGDAAAGEQLRHGPLRADVRLARRAADVVPRAQGDGLRAGVLRAPRHVDEHVLPRPGREQDRDAGGRVREARGRGGVHDERRVCEGPARPAVRSGRDAEEVRGWGGREDVDGEGGRAACE